MEHIMQLADDLEAVGDTNSEEFGSLWSALHQELVDFGMSEDEATEWIVENVTIG